MREQKTAPVIQEIKKDMEKLTQEELEELRRRLQELLRQRREERE